MPGYRIMALLNLLKIRQTKKALTGGLYSEHWIESFVARDRRLK